MTLPAELTADADPTAGFERQVAPLIGDLHRQALRMTVITPTPKISSRTRWQKPSPRFTPSGRTATSSRGYTGFWSTPISAIAAKPSGAQRSIWRSESRICKLWRALPIRPWGCPRRKIRR